MAGLVVLEPTSVAVVPGGEAVCSVRIRNTGQVVDQFTLTVLGEAAAWATVIPPVVSLFPGAEGGAEIHFRPPRAASIRAGGVDFALRAVGSEDPDGSVVEEGALDLAPFTELSARITPRTSEGKRSAHHEIIIDNKGNSPLSVEFAASDPDELLAFALKPPRLDIPPGSSAHAQVKVAARKGFMRGPAQNRQFMVDVTPDSADGSAYPTRLDANFSQRAGMPAFLLPLVVAVVAIALIVVLLPLLKKKDTVTLSATKGAVTTVAPDPSVDDAAAAAAETAVADPVDPTAGKQPFKFADPTTPAAAGSPAPASQGGTNGTAVASPAPTTPPTSAAPGASPTTVQATTTTAAPTTTTTQTTADVYYEAKQEDAGQAHYVFVGGGTVGQTFKATQPVITEAWLNLSGDKVTFNLRKTGPGGQVVGTVANVQIVSFAFTKVTFNPPISVTNGATYYLEGVGVGAQDMYAWFSNANDYAFGDGWFNGAAQGNDLNARVIGRTS